MARINLTVTEIVRAGVTRPAGQVPTDTGGLLAEFANDGRTIIEVTIGTGPRVLSVLTPGVVDADLAIGDRTLTGLASASVTLLGPFPPSIYSQGDGKVHLNGDAGQQAQYTFRAYRVP
jgi:hypothetical protein